MREGTTGSLVSVIVPAWNAEKTLLETLDSAAAQTHRNLEIVIVDDGSTDRTAEIAAEFCACERRARLIRTGRGGLASARNRGIDEAKGEWIAPLDADDLWHPEQLERQLRTFASSSSRVGFVYCWYRMIDESGRVLEEPWAPVYEGMVFTEHLKCNFGSSGSCLFKRSALGALRYSSELTRPDEGGCEDWLLQLQLAAEFEVACTPAFLMGYRVRAGSMSTDVPRMTRAHIHMYEIVRRDFPEKGQGVLRRELARWHARHALMQLRKSPAGGCMELAGALARAPLIAGKVVALELNRRLNPLYSPRSLTNHPSVGQPFYSLSPDVP